MYHAPQTNRTKDCKDSKKKLLEIDTFERSYLAKLHLIKIAKSAFH